LGGDAREIDPPGADLGVVQTTVRVNGPDDVFGTYRLRRDGRWRSSRGYPMA
jgi:hypothetical protein